MTEEQTKHEVPDIGGDIVKYQDGRLELAITPTWDQAVEVTDSLDGMGRNVAFWLGDWLNYCEGLFGEEWSQLIPVIGWEEKTLMNYKWVARAVHSDVRETRLSFSIHAVIAKLTPELQAVWLERALEGGWSCVRLSKELKGPPKEKEPKHRKLTLQCPDCEHRFEVEVDV